METIVLKPIVHRQQECIGVYFSNGLVLNKASKKYKWQSADKNAPVLVYYIDPGKLPGYYWGV